MRRAAIVAPVRTPVGRYLGALKDVPAEQLAAHVIRETVKRSGIDPARIEDVIFAQSCRSRCRALRLTAVAAAACRRSSPPR
jgi:acetyl-CoA C-acetyltransferase